MSTSLRGFDRYSKMQALLALEQRFGAGEFYFRDAVELEHVDAKVFAKLRCDGILIKIGKLWPAKWRISSEYLGVTCEPLAPMILKE